MYFFTELEVRQAKGYIDKDVFLLTVEDPKADVGSGGATINALLTVAEYISAQRGFNVRFNMSQNPILGWKKVKSKLIFSILNESFLHGFV